MAAITLEELLGKVSVHPEKLNDSISHDHLREISIFLTSWCKVATYLGLSENDLDDVEQEGKDEQEKRIKALQKWKGKFGFKATYSKLVEVLLSLAMADVAENVCHLLRGMCSKHLVVHHSTCSKKLSAWREVASFPGLPCLQFLITCSIASDQKLEPGKA